MTTGALAGRRPAMPDWPHAGTAADTAVDDFLRFLLCLFMSTLVVEGPLRWAVSLAGVPNLLYLRDAIPAGSLAILVLRSLIVRGWLELPVILGASVLAVHAVTGVVLGLAPFQVALGFKTFVYVLYGLAMWPVLQGRWTSVMHAALVVLVVSLAGLAVDFVFGPMPWEGLEYDTAFGAVATTWKWWLEGGIPRLPGFARTSFDAAMVVGLSSLLAMAWLRRPWLRLLLAALAFAGILVTTSKGMLLAFPLAAAWLVLAGDGAGQGRAGRWLVRGLCALGLVLPAAIVLFDLGAGVRPEGWPDVIHSAWERFSWVWPAAFELLPRGIVGLLGGGLGSIGTPQLFGFHPHHFSPADSLAVYLLVDFGLAGAVYYVLPALVLRRALAGLPDAVARACVAVLVICYGYGISISMVEETFFATSLGLVLGALVRGLESPRERP